MSSPFGETIDRYSRRDAIARGDLIDVTATARQAGIGLPTALTRAVYDDCVAWHDSDNDRKGTAQDRHGRLWDVLWMTRQAIGRSPAPTDRVRVPLVRVPRAGAGRTPRAVNLVAVCSPGDNNTPVITIQQPGQD